MHTFQIVPLLKLAGLRTSGRPELAALHAVNAAGIYYLALTLARQAFRFARNASEA